MKSRKNRHRRGNRRGASAVELAVLAPIFITLLLGTVAAAQFFNVWQKVSNASREGARVAARNSTTSSSQVESAVADYIADVFPSVTQATIDSALQTTVRDASDHTLTDLTSVTTGSQIWVDVSMDFGAVAWLKGVPGIDDQTATTTTVMRRE